jgi:hypothetical protein
VGIVQTQTLAAAVGTTKKQSNAAAKGRFTIAALAMGMDLGCIGELLPTCSREKIHLKVVVCCRANADFIGGHQDD